MKNKKIHTMVIAGLLCAIGIIIPMCSPLQIRLEPASFTLASHVAIMIAMFISPSVAIGVSLGTTLGFFMGGFPIVIVARALTHVIFASMGAYYLKLHPDTFSNIKKTSVFCLIISIIHGLSEVIIVCPFYFNHSLAGGYYTKGFVVTVLLLVGVGSLIHSIIDFIIAITVHKTLIKNKSIKNISMIKKIY